MYSCDMKPTSKTSIETQVPRPGRDFWNTENTRGTEKRRRLYDEQQLKRTEKQFNHRHTKRYRKNAAWTPDFSY